MDTVNTSSSVLLQKLDVTQQDLLKQTKEMDRKPMKVNEKAEKTMKNDGETGT